MSEALSSGTKIHANITTMSKVPRFQIKDKLPLGHGGGEAGEVSHVMWGQSPSLFRIWIFCSLRIFCINFHLKILHENIIYLGASLKFALEMKASLSPPWSWLLGVGSSGIE